MEFADVLARRASVRHFTEEAVPVDKLREMVRMAGTAPCIGGRETWSFIAVTNKELMRKMAEAVKQKYDEIIPEGGDHVTDNVRNAVESFSTIFLNAPAVIAVLSEPYTAVIDKVLEQTSYSHDDINELRNHPDIQTIGAAIENLLLAAVDMGYGACWQTGPMVAKEELSKLLGVKEPYSLFAFVAVGKPAVEIKPREKKPVGEMFSVIE